MYRVILTIPGEDARDSIYSHLCNTLGLGVATDSETGKIVRKTLGIGNKLINVPIEKECISLEETIERVGIFRRRKRVVSEVKTLKTIGNIYHMKNDRVYLKSETINNAIESVRWLISEFNIANAKGISAKVDDLVITIERI